MEQQTLRKIFKDKLKPTAEQERVISFVARRCRELYNAALQERQEAWQQCGLAITEAHHLQRPLQLGPQMAIAPRTPPTRCNGDRP